MAESVSREEIERLVGVELSPHEVEGLAAWYAAFSRGVAAFPAAELRAVEPPLRSVPGPLMS